jgi:DNA-binding transcriptional regulator YiaG
MTGQQAISIIDRLGISQRRFAYMVGMHPNAISKWAGGGKLSGPAVALLRLLDERPELVKVMEAWVLENPSR